MIKITPESGFNGIIDPGKLSTNWITCNLAMGLSMQDSRNVLSTMLKTIIKENQAIT